MQAQCVFCRHCADDSASVEKKYVPVDGKHAWECVDATACKARAEDNAESEDAP